MVVHGLLQSSTAGVWINKASGGKLLAWNDQRPDYVIPTKYLPVGTPSKSTDDSETTAVNTPVSSSGTSTPAQRPSLMDVKSFYRLIPHAHHNAYKQEPKGGDAISRRVTAANDSLGRRPTVCNQMVFENGICDQMVEDVEKQPEKVSRSKTFAFGTAEKPARDSANPSDSTVFDIMADRPERFEVTKDAADEAVEESEVEKIAKQKGYVIVDWDGPDDPENPRNWKPHRRHTAAVLICLLTFAVYAGSAIYTPSIPGLMEQLGFSLVEGTLGLTLFVLGYGIGAMFLVPLQEIARIGRNPIYISCLFVFVIFQLPIMFSNNKSCILAFRFLTGFCGSPALATGGASMGDMYPPSQLAYVLGVWSIGAVLGPLTGPVVGSFAAQAKGWQWTIYELTWLSSFAFVVLFLFLPETLEGCILLHRARRLRKLTGNPNLRSASEIEAEATPITELLLASLYRPFRLSLEPAVLFANVYLGLTYAIFYLWFEAFPIVFSEGFGFNLGVSTLPFLAFFVTGFLTFAFYVYYNKYILPNMARKRGGLKPEDFLLLGIFAAPSIPISLFIFGWTAHTQWIGPTIGAALYFPGIFYLFQTILLYLSLSYPKYQGSILAGNDCIRSCIAACFPLFGHRFFTLLGVGGGSSLLAGLEILMIPIFFALIKYGGRLRNRSKFAQADHEQH